MITRMRNLFACFILCCHWTIVHAEPEYPVDISYMVADFKYSREHGLKICEVQHGALSALNGDIFVAGESGSITPLFSDFFDQFPLKKWVGGLTKLPMRGALNENGWSLHRSLKVLVRNSTFLRIARSPPSDPCSIDSYAGIVYATCDMAKNPNRYRQAYPGILFIDAATLPYWIDKYKMNLLFNQNALLQGYKADWQLYPKKYTPQLAEKIQKQLPSELYVIKPRGEFKGKGVIIVAGEDLDGVLKEILEQKSRLKNHPDSHYSYWSNNNDDTFLIERFYRSDYLSFTDKLSEVADAESSSDGQGYHYDATMRIAFILKYDKGQMTFHCLGGYWKLPRKALEESGTENERRISCGALPFYRAVEPEILAEACAQLEVAMLLLYEIMLRP